MSYIKLLLLYRKHIACLLLCVAVWMNASVFSVIYHQLRYDPAQLQDIKIKDRYKVAVYWAGGVGDLMLAKVILQGLDNIGWSGIFAQYDNFEQQLNKIKEFDPDFIIVIGLNIFNNLGQEAYIKKIAVPLYPLTFSKIISINLKNSYSGYIVGVVKPYNSLKEARELLLNMLSRWDSKPFAYVPFHDSLPHTKFKVNNYSNVAVVGSRWDRLRNSDKYTSFLAILGSKGYLNIYGPNRDWQHQLVQPYWREYVKELDALQKIYQENGIALVMHAQNHFIDGLTSLRIIEPIAAGAVVICDNHPKVKEYFGDSVLYFDQTKSAEEIAATIDGHVSWIRSHPREASEMARRAHAIFLQHFTIEEQLVKVAQMHEYILKQKL